jgi:lipopolysaccharide export LptBFGC system permease protein LptF
MKLRQISWWRAIAGALGAEVTLVTGAFAWVALYSHLIHPGKPVEFYRRYALGASPWVAVLVGVPLFYLAGRWIRARVPATAVATAMGMLGFYLLLEAPFLLLGDNPLMPYWLPTAGYAGKGVAIYLGAMGSGRRESPVREA